MATDLKTSHRDLAVLRPLAREFPNIDAAMAEIARLSGEMVLPKGTIHVISDVHGEAKKLRHIINNASGTLRPLVERLFARKMDPKNFQDFLNLLFYPAEVVERLELTMTDPQAQKLFAHRVLSDMFEIVRVLARRYPMRHAVQVFPKEYRELLIEVLHEPSFEHGKEYVAAIVDELVRRGRVLHLIHLTARVIRNLAVSEIVLDGDCWDRGPRGDNVVEYLMKQPRVAFVWGNHDAAWFGAALGHDALIAHVLRISLRYRRLSQLEEGYGITMQPLEHLVRAVYADDPATLFLPKGDGLREAVMIARMQKAATIIQFKLEGQMLARNPEWQLEHRRLLHSMDLKAGTIMVDGKSYSIRDAQWPTFDPKNPYELSVEEKKCMARIRDSFQRSQKLFEHVSHMIHNGSMYLRRDDHLIFHGCVPVDEKGDFLFFPIDGQPYSGRALFDAIESVVARALERGQQKDLDLLWYLWSGPRSPLFGKDRIATLEMALIEDKATHHETKNPYFQLIHEKDFCEKILAEFGVDPEHGLIVNGHVPVKVEKGEDPLKRSGKAITIDGAFSEAYGDHGYTLVLEADQTFLAEHYHFESVDAALKDGVDIIPKTTVVRKWDHPRRVSDTERGMAIRAEIELLERLIGAYRQNALQEGR